MQWLFTLGVTYVDWWALKTWVIMSDSHVALKRVMLKNLMKAWDITDQGYLVKFCALKAWVTLGIQNGIDSTGDPRSS